jgi:hypothetical protein
VSLIRPKDGDYIGRGLSLLLAWFIVGMPGMSFAAALVSGNAAMAVLGIPLALVTGIVGYGLYLNFGLREHDKGSSERLELMLEERRILREMQIEMQMRGHKR